MGRPSRYTPEFLRSLLTWDGDGCAMPDCGFKKMARDDYYKYWRSDGWDEKCQWNVCRCCWYLLKAAFTNQRRQYETERWRLERPADLRCFKCDTAPGLIPFPQIDKHLAAKDGTFAQMKACPAHRNDAFFFMYDSWQEAEKAEFLRWCVALQEHWALIEKGWKEMRQKKRRTVNLLALTMQEQDWWKSKKGNEVWQRLSRLQAQDGQRLSRRQLVALAVEKFGSASAR